MADRLAAAGDPDGRRGSIAPWRRLEALVSIAADQWARGASAMRAGAPPDRAALGALKAAIDAPHASADWSSEELAAARRAELALIAERARTYLRDRPIHWSLAKARELAGTRGWGAAAADAGAAAHRWAGNLLPVSPFQHSPFNLRPDIGGRLLDLADLAGCSDPSARAAPRDERDAALLAHGAWRVATSVSCVDDFMFGMHYYGWGAWLDQWSARGEDSSVGRWGAKLLAAAEAQERMGLPAPKEDERVLDAFGVFAPNHAEHSVRGDSQGRAQWTWAARFPLPDLSPTMRALHIERHWRDPSFNQAWLSRPPASWLEIIGDGIERKGGPDCRELRELHEIQGGFLALRQARAIDKGLAEPGSLPAGRPKRARL